MLGGRRPHAGYGDLPGCPGVGNTAPLWTYPHGPQGTSVTGGIVYTGSSYPEQYRGAYFFGDYASQRLYSLRYDASGQLVTPPEADGFGVRQRPTGRLRAAANGDLVYADIGGSKLKRLVYVPGNRPPTAVAMTTTDPATRGRSPSTRRVQRPRRRSAHPPLGLRGRRHRHRCTGQPHLRRAGYDAGHRPADGHRPRGRRGDDGRLRGARQRRRRC